MKHHLLVLLSLSLVVACTKKQSSDEGSSDPGNDIFTTTTTLVDPTTTTTLAPPSPTFPPVTTTTLAPVPPVTTTTTLPSPTPTTNPGPAPTTLPPTTTTTLPAPSPSGHTRIVPLREAFFVRTLQNGVLEPVDWISGGGAVELYYENVYRQFPYRLDNGSTTLSSFGFVYVKSIRAVAPIDSGRLTPAYIQHLLSLPGGLFISDMTMTPGAFVREAQDLPFPLPQQ